MSIKFIAWPKIPRIENEKVTFTEKIDGTNACVVITEDGDFGCQSRSRIITPENDNFGFARWAYEHKEELMTMGPGYHYGEWWGLGIQRGYNQTEKKFSLFNSFRWGEHNPPECCSVVPIVRANNIEEAKEKLISNGSFAAPGFMAVEGLIMYNHLSRTYYKIIINK